MLKVCFLTSGGGGNMKFMYLAKQMGILKDFELFVIADRECGGIHFAKEKGLNSKIINYKRDNNKELSELLESINPDIIITTWAKIIDKELVEKYSGKMINLHYSLLPAFAGQMGVEPIENAYKQNCQYIGVTCHYVSEDVDMGKIISQAILKTNIPIEDAIKEVFQKGCLILLNSIMIVTKELIIKKEENSRFDYSPELMFDDKVFDKTFWDKISLL